MGGSPMANRGRKSSPAPLKPLILRTLQFSTQGVSRICLENHVKKCLIAANQRPRTTAILPPFLHIPRGRGRERRKEGVGRWGVSEATTGASPRNPQWLEFQYNLNFKPLQIADILKTAICRITADNAKLTFHVIR